MTRRPAGDSIGERLQAEYFPERIGPVRRIRRLLRFAITWLGLAWSRLSDDDEQIIEDLISLGFCVGELGNLEGASRYFEQAKSASAGTSYEAAGTRAACNLAAVSFRRQAWKEVVLELEPELPRIRLLRNKQIVADAMRDLGIAYEKLGQPGRALAMYEESLTVSSAGGIDSRQALAKRNLGGLAYQEGHWEKARGKWADSLEVFRRRKDARGVAMMAYWLALALLQQHKVDAARTLFEESCTVYTRLGLPDLAARSQAAIVKLSKP